MYNVYFTLSTTLSLYCICQQKKYTNRTQGVLINSEIIRDLKIVLDFSQLMEEEEEPCM